MSHPTPSAGSVPPSPPPATFHRLQPGIDSDFDARWAAWQARGRRGDEAARRHLLIGVPLLGLVAAGFYLLLGR